MRILTREQEEKLVRDCFENFPEASSGSALRCDGWDYDGFIFSFIDEETGKRHTVNLKKAIKGLHLLTRAVLRGELKGLGLPAHFLMDAGEWDGYAYDALAQMAVFGEVIYG